MTPETPSPDRADLDDLPDDVPYASSATPDTFVTPPRAPRRRRWWLIGALVLLVGSAAAYFGLVRDSKSEGPGAVVVFHIAPERPLLPGPPESPDAFESYARSQIGLVKLRSTLNAALNNLREKKPREEQPLSLRDAEPEQLTWLEENLHITREPGSEYMRIVLKGKPVDEMVKILDAVAKAYLETSHEREASVKQRRLDELQKEYEAIRNVMKRFHDKLNEYAAGHEAGSEKTFEILHKLQLESFRECYVTLDRTRHELTLLLATLAGKPDPAHQQALTAVGGGLLGATGPVRLLPPRPEDTPEGWRLQVQIQVTLARLEDIRRTLYQSDRVTREIEQLCNEMRIKQEFADLLAREIERLQLESKALPRVTLMGEAAALR